MTSINQIDNPKLGKNYDTVFRTALYQLNTRMSRTFLVPLCDKLHCQLLLYNEETLGTNSRGGN